MSLALDVLNQKFALDNKLCFVDFNGMPAVRIRNEHAEALATLHGGQVLSYKPHGEQPVLWLSDESLFEFGKPIRGGIPICWPWFGPHPDNPAKPNHGFVRTLDWDMFSSGETSNGNTTVQMVLRSTDETMAVWPHHFKLSLLISVGASLRVELTTENTSCEDMRCTGALHTYFSVSDISAVSVHGLENGTYLDNLENLSSRTQDGLISFDREVDRVFIHTEETCLLEDAGWQRMISVAKEGSRSTVVWNPWIDKAARMKDFGDHEYQRMVCIETANAGPDAITIFPGNTWRLKMEVKKI